MPAIFGKITEDTNCSICKEPIREDEPAAVEFRPDGDLYACIIAHPACLVTAKIDDLKVELGL